MKVFIDLEDTLIRSWQNPTFLPREVAGIIGVLRQEKVAEVSIFSFAIYDDLDKETFELDLKRAIEQQLGAYVVEWLSVQEMQAIVQQYDGIRYDNHLEFIQLKGKHNAFIDVCLAREHDTTVMLIDDCVPRRTVIDEAKHLTIELLPVQQLAV